MNFDWVWGKQLLLVGVLGLCWPMVFRSVASVIIRQEGEEMPGPNWRTLVLSFALAIGLPLLGEGLFYGLSFIVQPTPARIIAMAALGAVLGVAATRLPYFNPGLSVVGGVVFGLGAGFLYGYLAWPYSAMASLTLLAAGPMLGLSSPVGVKWRKMVAGTAIYPWRGRIG